MVDDRQHADEHSRKGHTVLALVLAAVGVGAALSIGIAALDPTGFFGFLIAVPGRFLFSTLHVAAWWVPFYLVILAVFSGRSAPMTWPTVVLINLVHIPVLTIATILRLLALDGAADAPFLALLINGFTFRGAMLVLSLVLALEALGILQAWRFFENRISRGQEDTEEGQVHVPRLPAP